MEENKSKLEKVLSEYKDMSNKELAEHITGLRESFEQLKDSALLITQMLIEVEEVHDKLYYELNERIKFDEKKD